jgi:hypothetical protein
MGYEKNRAGGWVMRCDTVARPALADFSAIFVVPVARTLKSVLVFFSLGKTDLLQCSPCSGVGLY